MKPEPALQRLARQWGALLLLVVLALPALEMLRIALSRVTFPYELEWLEGESMMQALRFSRSPSLDTLYPRYGEAGHTPHLYTPLYHMLLGVLMRVTGSVHLGLGRAISIASTLLCMAGIFAIVREHARDPRAAFAGALAFAWFYLPSGFWYDLARVDSLAACLATWSCWAFARRRQAVAMAALGAALGLLAFLAKQTSIVLPMALVASRVACEAASLVSTRRWRRESTRVVLGVLAGAAVAGATMLVLHSDRFENMRFYTLVLGANHGLLWEYIRREGPPQAWLYTPWWTAPAGAAMLALLALRPAPMRRRIAQIAGALLLGGAVLVVWWVGRALEAPDFHWVGDGNAPTLRPHAVAYVAGTWSMRALAGWVLLAAGLGGALGNRLAGARWVPGSEWILAAAMVQHLAAISFCKVGAYVNNLMPMFVVLSVVFGFGVAWMGAAATRLERRVPLFSQHFAWVGLALLMAAGWFMGGFKHDRTDVFILPQIPSERTREYWDARRDAIARLDADGGLYSPNHNYMNMISGATIGQSIDAIRDVVFLGPPTPESLISDIERGRWKHIVLSFKLEEAPLPNDFRLAIFDHYDAAGTLLPESFAREGDDLWSGPRMGWGVVPKYVYTRKAGTGQPAS